MPARIGDRPMGNSERQKRQRQKLKARLDAAEEAVRFVLALRPGRISASQLTELQRKLEMTR